MIKLLFKSVFILRIHYHFGIFPCSAGLWCTKHICALPFNKNEKNHKQQNTISISINVSVLPVCVCFCRHTHSSTGDEPCMRLSMVTETNKWGKYSFEIDTIQDQFDTDMYGLYRWAAAEDTQHVWSVWRPSLFLIHHLPRCFVHCIE